MLFLVFCISFLAGVTHAVTPVPVSYWEYEETTGTVAGDTMSLNDGSLVGLDFAVDSVAGRAAGTYALQFGAAGSSVTVPASTSLNSYTAMTAMCWVKVDDFGGGAIGAFMGNENYTSAQYRGFAMVEYPDTRFATYADAGGGSAGITDPGTLPLGEWMMLTYTHDGTNGALYVNNTQVVVPTALPNQALATAVLMMGNSPEAAQFGDRPLHGAMDEAAFWDVCLSADDVADVYANGVTIPEPATMVLLGLGALTLLRKRR